MGELTESERISELELEVSRLKEIIKNSEPKLNPHRMDKTKAHLLIRMYRIQKTGTEWIKIQQDGDLIRSSDVHRTIQTDAVHANRLKWFGLVDLKEKRSGEYRLNDRGLDFLRGILAVPSRIMCLKGQVISEETEKMVYLKDVKGVILDKEYWNQYPGNELRD